MLCKTIFALLAFQSLVLAASATYSASVSCSSDGSLPSVSSSSDPSLFLSKGCYGTGSGIRSNGIAEIELGDLGPTQATFVQSAGVLGSTTARTSIQDPNMRILNTGLPSGTVLDVQVEWSSLGSSFYSVNSPTAIAGESLDLQLTIDNLSPVTNTFQLTDCFQYQPGCTLVGVSEGDGGTVLDVAKSFQTTVGSSFTSTLSLENSVNVSGTAYFRSNFLIDPVKLASFKVVNSLTGDVIKSAVLEGSNGPYQVAAVPEIDANSSASAIALIAGVLFIFRGRRFISS